ncbi:acyl-CoA carboxylase subunit beta, partial [bacterium]|nr:acyl-CoA carboxylase subunit beta [bacterium]
MKDRLAHLEELRAEARAGGGPEAVERQHKKGKLTARERLDILLDDGSFVEMDAFVRPATVRYGNQKNTLGDGLVSGHGRVEGRHVFVYSQDFTVMGGSLGERHAQKILKVANLARKTGAPLIAIQDSGGARIQEGVFSLGGYAEIFRANTLTSGVVPQIAVVLGPCAGGAVYSPGLMDFIFMVENTSHMFLTGPDVIKTVLHEEVTFDELGGAAVHAEKSGVAHFVHQNEVQSLRAVRDLLAYLPANNLETPPVVDITDDPERRDQGLNDIVPQDPNKPYDIKGVIDGVMDRGTFLEVHEAWARNLVVGFARMDGSVVGVVANQPAVLAGVLEVDACVKGARFIRFCDAFNIPIISFVDVPGFLPGADQEHGGVIKHGAKLLYAYCEATVPRIT